jgi:hypothetical protein
MGFRLPFNKGQMFFLHGHDYTYGVVQNKLHCFVTGGSKFQTALPVKRIIVKYPYTIGLPKKN